MRNRTITTRKPHGHQPPRLHLPLFILLFPATKPTAAVNPPLDLFHRCLSLLSSLSLLATLSFCLSVITPAPHQEKVGGGGELGLLD